MFVEHSPDDGFGEARSPSWSVVIKMRGGDGPKPTTRNDHRAGG